MKLMLFFSRLLIPLHNNNNINDDISLSLLNRSGSNCASSAHVLNNESKKPCYTHWALAGACLWYHLPHWLEGSMVSWSGASSSIVLYADGSVYGSHEDTQ